MIGLVLVTHGRLAVEFAHALEHIVGNQDHIESVCIEAEDRMEARRADIGEAIRRVETGSGVIILTDMFGGTPSNLAISLMELGRVEVVAGLNLPMLVKLARVRKDKVVDHHDDYAVLAVQGTRSDEVLDAVGLPTGHDYMSFVEAEFGRTSEGDALGVVVCRTGYTGERGYELVIANSAAGELWDALMAAGAEHGITACGLGARDTLRTEMGYPLHGQDISLATNPVEAGLSWAVGWKKNAFWGRDAVTRVKEEGPKRRLRGLVAVGRGIPRPGMGVTLTHDVPLADITSGTFSPTLRKGIGLALIPTMVAEDAQVGVDIRGRREIFQLVKPPFVDPSVREG